MVTLNETIVAYLTVNSIPFSDSDYLTCQPDGALDQIVYWNTQALGPQPTQQQLDEAYPIWEGQQIQAQNKQQASALLSATDWTTIPDVADPAVSDPYLMNQAEYAAYRSQVRAIAVNPPTTPAVFPTQPTSQWSNK